MNVEPGRVQVEPCSDREPLLFESPIGQALVDVIRERGYKHATVEEFALRAGVSRARFDREFAGREDVVLRVLESAVAAFRAQVQEAFESESSWPDNLRAAAWAAQRWLAAHPDCAWFGLVGSLEGPELGRVLREEVVLWGADLIDQGRLSAPDPAAIPKSAPLFAIGAIADILRRRYEGSQRNGLRVGPQEMMHLAVLPYLDKEAAMRELLDPGPSRQSLGDSANLRTRGDLAEVRVDGHVDEGGQELTRARSAAA